MRILVIGGTGTIGSAVVQELSQRHEVVVAGSTHSDVTVDICNPESIKNMYAKIGKLDGVAITAGKVHFGEFASMSQEELQLGLNNKLMGQVNVVRFGLNALNLGGSFTLTSGILNRDPIRLGSSAAMVNGALDGFVTGAAIELLAQNLRINCISPTVLTEAMPSYAPYFRGYQSVAAEVVALAYSKSIEGAQTGQIYSVG